VILFTGFSLAWCESQRFSPSLYPLQALLLTYCSTQILLEHPYNNHSTPDLLKAPCFPLMTSTSLSAESPHLPLRSAMHAAGNSRRAQQVRSHQMATIYSVRRTKSSPSRRLQLVKVIRLQIKVQHTLPAVTSNLQKPFRIHRYPNPFPLGDHL
jgi:hypothetical protein